MAYLNDDLTGKKMFTFKTIDGCNVVINKRQRKPKGRSRMHNSEKLATLCTQDT